MEKASGNISGLENGYSASMPDFSTLTMETEPGYSAFYSCLCFRFHRCPCFDGEACIWVSKVIVEDDDSVPLGFTKQDMERFRLLRCVEAIHASWGFINEPHFIKKYVCPGLRNLVPNLKIQRPPSPKPISNDPNLCPCGFERHTCWPPPGKIVLKPEQEKKAPSYARMDIELGMSLQDRLKLQPLYCAEIALADYNKKQSTNYKLVEIIESNSFMTPSVWFHCAFRAAIDTSSAPELFFTEMHNPNLGEFVVTTMHILDDTEATYDDCMYCKGLRILHPVNRFCQGLPN